MKSCKKNEKVNAEAHAAPTPPKGFGSRHTQALLLFISITVAYSLRANLSVSMVAMTTHTFNDDCTTINQTEFNSVNSTDENSTAEFKNGMVVNGTIAFKDGINEVVIRTPEFINGINDVINGTDAVVKGNCEKNEIAGWSVYRKYSWHKSTQEMIVFSFFLGYTSMQLPMGYVAQRRGGKEPIMAALLVNGLVSLVTPWLPIMGGWMALAGARLVQGMSQAALFPSIHTMLAKWAPLSERGRLSTYVYSGAHFGTIVIFQASGYFAGSSLGWPATFWFCGVLSLSSFALLWWLGASSPHEHPNISVEEMNFILEGGTADVVPKKRRTPWKQILSSKAVWALVTAHAGSACTYILLMTQSPTYMSYVLQVEIQKNGLFSSLPYAAMVVTTVFCGFLADFLANRNILRLVNIRRVACTTGLIISGLFLIWFSYAQHTILAVSLLIITLTLHSAVHVGHHINQIDLAPNFAGNIMALGNMVANMMSLLVPVIVSNVVQDDLKNQQRWQIVFFIFVGFLFVANTVFVIFCKGSVQPWNFYGEEENDADSEETKTLEEKNEKLEDNEKQQNNGKQTA